MAVAPYRGGNGIADPRFVSFAFGIWIRVPRGLLAGPSHRQAWESGTRGFAHDGSLCATLGRESSRHAPEAAGRSE